MSTGIGARIRRKLAALWRKIGPVVRPALHTFWQAFLAALGVWWAAAGLDLSGQVTDVASAKRFVLAALLAIAAAALSAIKGTIKQLATPGHKSQTGVRTATARPARKR